MSRVRMAIVLLVAFVLSAYAHAQYVHTQGDQIVDATGHPLLLHGTNLGDWMVTEGYMWQLKDGPQSTREIEELVTEMLGPTAAQQFWRSYRDTYITRDDIVRIKHMGFDSVRIPMHWKLFVGNDPEGFAMLDRVIGWCHDEGLYVVLDLHAAPGGQTGANIDDSNGWPWLFTDEGMQRQTVYLWRRIAERYRDDPTVLGYDLLNEPLPTYPQMRQFDGKLEPLYRRITQAIRTADRHHIIILGGAKWDGDFTVFGKPFDSNVVYQVHQYWSQPVQASIQKYVDFRTKYHVPIWMGETGENNDQWIAAFAHLLERNDIGWAFWPYKKMDATSSPVTFGQPAHWGEIVQYATINRNLGGIEDRLKHRPAQSDIDEAFRTLLENIRFDHERVNEGYVHALFPDSDRVKADRTE